MEKLKSGTHQVQRIDAGIEFPFGNTRKGISPLIASVLLIAFTISVAVLFSPFATNMIQNIQEGTSQKTVDVTRASELGLDIMSVEFNRSSNELEVIVQNTGEAINNKTNISAGVIGGSVAKNQVYDVNLGSKEITTLKLPVDRTYPLETLKVDMTNYPVSRESGIKCTPTQGLVGYWTLNSEHTSQNYAEDLSNLGNNGSLEGGISKNQEGIVGESYFFDGSDDWVRAGNNENYETNETTLVAWIKTDSLSDSNLPAILSYSSSGSTSDIAHLLYSGDNVNGRIWFTNGSEAEAFNGNTALSDNNWHLVAGVITESQLKLFVDGDKDGTSSRSLVSINYKSSQTPNIGTYGMTSTTSWKGKIDEPRIYNRSLSQSEIQRLYSVRSKDWAVNGCKLTG